MYNLNDFTEYTGQSIKGLLKGKAVLCWSKKGGYYFVSCGLTMLESEAKVIAVEK